MEQTIPNLHLIIIFTGIISVVIAGLIFGYYQTLPKEYPPLPPPDFIFEKTEKNDQT